MSSRLRSRRRRCSSLGPARRRLQLPAAATATPPPPSAGDHRPRRASPSAAAGPSAAPVKLTVGLGFIPSVQFAQFYLADQAGYYAEAGLDVEFQNKIDPDLVTLVGQGAIDVGHRRRHERHPGRQPGHPDPVRRDDLRQVPVDRVRQGVVGDRDRGRPQGQEARHPGPLRLVLDHAPGAARVGRPDARRPRRSSSTPTSARAPRSQPGAVDAATGFANNEPVQLELTGEEVTVLRVDDITPLPGPGLIAGDATLEAKRDAIAAFVAATLRAMEEITANPQVGLDAAIKAVPELATARDDAGGHPRRDDRRRGRARSRRPTASAPSTPPAGRRRSTT